MNIGWRIKRALRGDKATNREFSARYRFVEVPGREENQPLPRPARERAVSVPAAILLSVALCSLVFSAAVMNTIGKSTTVIVVVKDESEQVIQVQEAGLRPSITTIKGAMETKMNPDEGVMKYDILGNELGSLPITAP